MDPQVAAALIAAVVAIVGLLATWRQQRALAERQEELSTGQQQAQIELEKLRDELASQRDREKRERDAEDQLNLYREPLLDAAKDLFHRIRNVREMGFLGYLESPDDHRRQIAMLGTLYRFAKYWGTVDSLYGTVNLLQFERHEATKGVAALLSTIGTVFAGDSREYGGQTLMVWREEQRAIAELIQTGSPTGKPVVGFASFVQRYETEFAVWFTGFEQQLRAVGVEFCPRLDVLQATLKEVVQTLEAERAGFLRVD